MFMNCIYLLKALTAASIEAAHECELTPLSLKLEPVLVSMAEWSLSVPEPKRGAVAG